MADICKKSRKSNFSQEEVDILVKTVGKNYDVLYGEYSKRAIYKDVRHQAWLDVTNEVNQVSMEKRTLQEVKNKWKKCQHLYRGEDLLDISDEFDSMPLEQRLKSPALPSSSEQEQILHSHPLTPTKLKVTRQTKLKELSPKPVTPLPVEEICLKWNSHHGNMQTMFPALLLKEQYVDVTLVADGQTLKCHRIILSSCSPYFEEVLSSISPYQHPVLFMKDMPFWILKSLCDFMYTGEVLIPQDKLNELLVASENLKIKGLAGTSNVPSEDTRRESLIKNIKEELTDEPMIEKEWDRKENLRDKKRHHHSSTANSIPTMDIPKNAKLPKTNTYAESTLGKTSKMSKPNTYNESVAVKTSTKTLRANVSYTEPLPVKPSSAKVLRSSNVQKKIERSDKLLIKETISKGDILDPFDLLEPVYEEVQKEPKSLQNKLKESNKTIPVRKSVQKKVKKRKITDDRDESPPPVLSRKGTRSRPNKKIPKFYHSGFDNSTPKIQESLETTIVREPHTIPATSLHAAQSDPADQTDPLFQLEHIKSEPLDVEDSTIEIEDNLVNFSEPDASMTEEELLEETFEPPVMTFEEKTEPEKPPEETPFKKIRVVRQQVLLDVEKADTVKIVDVDKIIVSADDLEEDPLNLHSNLENNIKIMNVESINEIKETTSENSEVGFNVCEESEVKQTEPPGALGFKIASVVSEVEEEKPDGEIPTPVCQIADVFSETECENNKENITETEDSDKRVSEATSDGEKSGVDERSVANDVEENEQHQDQFVGVDVSKGTEESDELEGRQEDNEKSDVITSGDDAINQIESNQNENIEATDVISKSDPSDVVERDSNDQIIQSNNSETPLDSTDEQVADILSNDTGNDEELPVQRPPSNPDFDLKTTHDTCLEEETFDGIIAQGSEPSDVPTDESQTKDPVLANAIPYTNDDLSMPSQNEDLSMTSQPEELHMEVCDEVFPRTPSFDQPSNSFELVADVVQNDVSSYSTPGFHIAQVISEQIALNEECRLTTQPMDTTDACFEGTAGGNNELEMIVNDLTKMVGDSQRLETHMEHEDIADSLENLLEK